MFSPMSLKQMLLLHLMLININNNTVHCYIWAKLPSVKTCSDMKMTLFTSESHFGIVLVSPESRMYLSCKIWQDLCPKNKTRESPSPYTVHCLLLPLHQCYKQVTNAPYSLKLFDRNTRKLTLLMPVYVNF